MNGKKFQIQAGSVSWIDQTLLPKFGYGDAVRSKTSDNGWIVGAMIGLLGTANNPPPDAINFKSFLEKKDFRALLSCTVDVELGPSQNKDFIKVSRITNEVSILNPGWTPPFNTGRFRPAMIDADARDTAFYAGELSPCSQICLGKRHPHSVMAAIGPRESIVMNGIVKFRAGAHTDSLGSSKVGVPFHVPWVWCETLLTYADGEFKLYGRGSLFPTHTWYFNKKKIESISQISDQNIPYDREVVIYADAPMPVYKPERMNLYQVLSKGISAQQPQFLASNDAKLGNGSIEKHPYTVAARKTQVLKRFSERSIPSR